MNEALTCQFDFKLSQDKNFVKNLKLALVGG